MAFGLKTIKLSWPEVAGATHYEVYENVQSADASAPEQEVLLGTVNTAQFERFAAIFKSLGSRYSVRSCDGLRCSVGSVATAVDQHLPQLSVDGVGYIKPAARPAHLGFGRSMALSADGNTMAVGSYGGRAFSPPSGGSVIIFERNPETNAWSQSPDVLFLEGVPNMINFGSSVALSADGNTLVVGADEHDSKGAAFVYERNANSRNWVRYDLISDASEGEYYGRVVEISADGKTVAVTAAWDLGTSVGVGTEPSYDTTVSGGGDAGAVYLFTRDAEGWTKQAYFKAHVVTTTADFGVSMSLSSDGNLLVVGAPNVKAGSNVVGYGVVYVFARTGNEWRTQQTLHVNQRTVVNFGKSLSLAPDGKTMAVGDYLDYSPVAGTNAVVSNPTTLFSGAVHLFKYNAGTASWIHTDTIKPTHALVNFVLFGRRVALAEGPDGTTLAVTASVDPAGTVGLSKQQPGPGTLSAGSGAVYVYLRPKNSTRWELKSFVKSPRPAVGQGFGATVALSANGDTLATSSFYENSASTGINQFVPGALLSEAGAVYLY
jgi:hypothetical protein